MATSLGMTAYGNVVTLPKFSHTEPSETSQISSAQLRTQVRTAQHRMISIYMEIFTS